MERLDIYLVNSSLASSRERAKRMIEEGRVCVNGSVCLKPSKKIDCGDNVTASDGLKYVGRGALKLIGAFEAFGLDVKDKVCADIGASTGGFTQVLLERGAKKVYAADVGHGQLSDILINDSRVVNLEGVNARDLTPEMFNGMADFVCCDLSFISLKLTLAPMAGILADGADMTVLIKPQFEADRGSLNKNGILKDRKKHIEILDSLIAFFAQTGLTLAGIVPSPITGGDGNIEYLAHLIKGGGEPLVIDINELTDKAFAQSKK